MASGKRSLTLVAVDSSQEAENALFYFLDNFYRSGTSVKVLYCPSIKSKDEAAPKPTSRASIPFDDWMGRWDGQAKADKLIERYKGKISRKHTLADVTFQVEQSGAVGPEIVAQCSRLGAGLVVVGSGGETRARPGRGGDRDVLGSVTRHVLQHSPVPVLVCRPPEDDPQVGRY